MKFSSFFRTSQPRKAVLQCPRPVPARLPDIISQLPRLSSMNVRLPNQQDAPGYCYGLPASKLLTPDWKTQGVVRECNATPLRNLRAAAHAVLVQRCKLGTQGLRSNDEGMARALAAATKVAASSSVVTLVILVAGGAAGVGSTAAVATARPLSPQPRCMRQCPDPELSRAHACLSLYLAVHLSWVSTHSSPESKVYVSVRVYMSAERRQVYMQTWGPFMFCSSGWSSASHQVAFISTLAISICIAQVQEGQPRAGL